MQFPTDADLVWRFGPSEASHTEAQPLCCCVGLFVRRQLEVDCHEVGARDAFLVIEDDALHLGEYVIPRIVAVGALTAAGRGEVLALRWIDLDLANKTLTITRALEQTKKHGIRFKEPKTARSKRTFQIDDDHLALLLAEREKHLRFIAGVPHGVPVDLSLVKLPEDALMFPNSPAPGEKFSLTKPLNPNNTSRRIKAVFRRLGFPELRLHDLRGTHETLLLDSGVPVHTVARRGGHDPATLLRNYAKRTKKADQSAAKEVGALSKGVLGK